MPTNINNIIYPLNFEPIYKSRIWGGNLIAKNLISNSSQLSDLQPNSNTSQIQNNHKLNSSQLINNQASAGNTSTTPIGEVWQIVDRDEDQSLVANGALKGLSMNELRLKYGKLILGSEFNINQPFPLLIKIIDAGEDLSLQVHPKQEDLEFLEEGAAPKTEMWYILAAEKQAEILLGLKNNINKQDFINNLSNPNLRSLVNSYESVKDKYFFVKSGTIHAIGKGNLLLEIQQNSDTTYRVSDWGRVDNNTGKPRELHIEKSMLCIDFKDNSNKNILKKQIGKSNNNELQFKQLISPENLYFKVYYCNINASREYSVNNCYELITIISGTLTVIYNNTAITLNCLETYLLPANTCYSFKCNSQVRFLIYTSI